MGARDGQAARWTAERGTVELGLLPGSLSSEANDVSGDGSVVVGSALLRIETSGDGTYQHFRWTAVGGMAALGNPPGRYSPIAVSADGSVITAAAAISADGSVAVGTDGEGGFRRTSDGETLRFDLPRPNYASGVSADGSVVAGVFTRTERPIGEPAFRWTADGGTVVLGSLPGLNFNGVRDVLVSGDGAAVVGTSRYGGGCDDCLPRYEAWL